MSDLDPLDAWDSDVPFVERSWHRCPSCLHDEGRGVGGTPPWHLCTLGHFLEISTDRGKTCDRYSPKSWAVVPKEPKP